MVSCPLCEKTIEHTDKYILISNKFFHHDCLSEVSKPFKIKRGYA